MAPSEADPLLPTHAQQSSRQAVTSPLSTRPPRNVTFNPTVSTSSPPNRRAGFPSSSSKPAASLPSGLASTSVTPATRDVQQPLLSTLNSKLRRRNSSGSALTVPQLQGPKIGPQRTSRTAQKLKLLPNPEHGDDGPDEESGREVYSQFTRIKDPTARRDAARLGKEDKLRLPRVTAYCTASSYRLEELIRYLKGKSKTRGAAPKLFDECLYTPYSYNKDGSRRRRSSGNSGNQERPESEVAKVLSQPQRRFSDSAIEVEEHSERRREDLIDLQNETSDEPRRRDSSHFMDPAASAEDVTLSGEAMGSSEVHSNPDIDTVVHIPEVFLFEYGVVVIWGMSMKEEQRFLKELAKFENEKLSKDDMEIENFNFYYTKEYQARIYNDFITLREKRNYMTKIAISHALAQSTKTSLYEALVDASISTTQSMPSTIAQTGRINLTRREINMQIGELFILRINIHLQGSVLDAPELMWAEPQLEPVYGAVRAYLEMDQRVEALTNKLDVIADLLSVLKEQLTHTHGEYLEWIVIILIAAEILVAAINIIVDLYAGEA